ncbi:helix-turn-helix transcriptional regulator [Streptomyces sp. LP05-1]|uniref:Helix-turn-helix transcriptional regulator n=1 Tax=Streptomyces pyxinae TaxID=2970734 RepID=A0ABT2CM78_9ACTN|nr:helix-turn-helix transcriptional regulator [Streptomyces sp. LP05-1]MCS0638430.1 helix-turn-helix transcriptional regulator [Streptomyces sp. LP05-1]
METLRFDSGSLEATEEFMSRAYTPMRIGGRPHDTRTLVVRRAGQGISVDRLALDYTMAYDAGVLNKVTLLSIHAGTVVDTTGGRHEVYGPGETFLITRPDRPYTGEVRAARYTVAMFDPALLTDVAATGSRGGRGPVELTGHRAVDAVANRRLGATMAFLRDQVLAGPDTDGLVVATAVRHLAAVALASLPNTALAEEAHRADSRDAGTETLRRAMTYIEDNAHRDIGLADIAAAAYVTPRAAQYAFSRHAGTTPLGYLRRVRLDGAHAELKAANPRTTTVSAIATKWGFTHQGRFAAAYRSAYGAPPATTLHRPGA